MKITVSLFFLFFLFFSFCLNSTVWVINRPLANDIPKWANFGVSEGKKIYVNNAYNGKEQIGSIEKPFITVSKAIDAAKSHDEIIIFPGVYNENLRISKPHITIRSKLLHQAKIVSPVDDENIYFALRVDYTAHYLRFVGLDISGGYYYTISLESSWSDNVSDQIGVSHVILSQNKIHHSGRDLIKFKPMVNNVLIERNEIFFSGMRDPSNAEGIDNVNAHFLTIQDNYIHSIATTGVYVKGGASKNVIQRNLIEDVGFAGVLVGFDTSPDSFDLKRNPEMYEAIDTRVENNIINSTQASGIGLYAAKNTVIRYNTVLNSAQRYHAALFFGNTYQDRKLYAKRPASTDVKVFGNVFHVKSFRPVVNIRHTIDKQLGELPTLIGRPVLDNNFYSAGSSNVEFIDERKKSFFSNSMKFSSWQKWIGTDVNSKQGIIAVAANYSVFNERNTLEIEADGSAIDFYLMPRTKSNVIGAVNK